jgi:hypothetical protein
MYKLLPHKLDSSKVTIEASIKIEPSSIALEFFIKGELEAYIFPSSKASIRADELWRATCFEAFVKNEKSKEYWEFNLSPSGSWNFYHFTSYRDGMSEELRVNKPKVEMLWEG